MFIVNHYCDLFLSSDNCQTRYHLNGYLLKQVGYQVNCIEDKKGRKFCIEDKQEEHFEDKKRRTFCIEDKKGEILVLRKLCIEDKKKEKIVY